MTMRSSGRTSLGSASGSPAPYLGPVCPLCPGETACLLWNAETAPCSAGCLLLLVCIQFLFPARGCRNGRPDEAHQSHGQAPRTVR